MKILSFYWSEVGSQWKVLSQAHSGCCVGRQQQGQGDHREVSQRSTAVFN